MKGKRLKVGDILLLTLERGIAYLQYVGRHPVYGDGIRVGRARSDPSPIITEDLLADGFFTFYPANAALSQQLITVVGNLPAPPLPTVMRRPGAIVDRKVKTWLIKDGATDTVRWTLSKAETALPIAAIWNHELLIQRVAENWDPTSQTDRA